MGLLLAAFVLSVPVSAYAEPAAPQWRTDTQQPAAIFTYLGYRIGESLESVKTKHGPFPYAKQIGPHTVLFADTNGIGYPLLTELYFVDDRLSAMKATFDNGLTVPGEVQYGLEAEYGPPSESGMIEWVDHKGNLIHSKRVTWRTPDGPLQFDERFERLNTGAVQVNPDLIESLTKKNTL